MTRSIATKKWTQDKRDALRAADWRCKFCRTTRRTANHVIKTKEGLVVVCANHWR